MPFQNFFWASGLELPALEDASQETKSLYALQVVNIPDGVCAQIMRSTGRRVLKGIPRIISAS